MTRTATGPVKLEWWHGDTLYFDTEDEAWAEVLGVCPDAYAEPITRACERLWVLVWVPTGMVGLIGRTAVIEREFSR